MGRHPYSQTPSPTSHLSTTTLLPTSDSPSAALKSHLSFNAASEAFREKQTGKDLPPSKARRGYTIAKVFDLQLDPSDSDPKLLRKAYHKSPQDFSKKLKSTVRRGLKLSEAVPDRDQKLELSLTKVDLISRKHTLPKLHKKPRGPKTYISQEVDTGDPDYFRASPLLIKPEEDLRFPDDLSRILGVSLEESHFRNCKLRDTVLQSVEHMVKEQAHKRGGCRHLRERSVGKLPSLRRLTRKVTVAGEGKLWDRKLARLTVDLMTVGGGMGS